MARPSAPARSFALPRYLTWSMEMLSHLAPALGVKLALRLFFKPLRFPVPQRELAFRQKAQQYRLRTASGEPFSLFSLPGLGPKVLLVHGWSGRASQFFELAEALQKAGFQAFALEAPGHGDDLGPSTHMLSFVEAIQKAEAEHGPFSLALGHSLGGMALFNAAARGVALSHLVCMGSPANVSGVVADFCRRLHAGPKVYRGILAFIEKRYALRIEDISSDTLCQQLSLRGLLVHDEEDRDVGIEHAELMAEHWPEVEFMRTQGLGHRKILWAPEVIARLLDFLRY